MCRKLNISGDHTSGSVLLVEGDSSHSFRSTESITHPLSPCPYQHLTGCLIMGRLPRLKARSQTGDTVTVNYLLLHAGGSQNERCKYFSQTCLDFYRPLFPATVPSARPIRGVQRIEPQWNERIAVLCQGSARLSHRFHDPIISHSECFHVLYLSLPTFPADPYPLVLLLPPSTGTHLPNIVHFIHPILCSPIRTFLPLPISGAVLDYGI